MEISHVLLRACVSYWRQQKQFSKYTHLLRIKKWPIFRYEKNFIMNNSFITKIVDKCWSVYNRSSLNCAALKLSIAHKSLLIIFYWFNISTILHVSFSYSSSGFVFSFDEEWYLSPNHLIPSLYVMRWCLIEEKNVRTTIGPILPFNFKRLVRVLSFTFLFFQVIEIDFWIFDMIFWQNYKYFFII